MKTERHTIGPFRFTFRGGRVWWRYSTKYFGTRITASESTSNSLGKKLHVFLTTDKPNAWADSGLIDFVCWCMTDIPGARHWAEHWTRVENVRKGHNAARPVTLSA